MDLRNTKTKSRNIVISCDLVSQWGPVLTKNTWHYVTIESQNYSCQESVFQCIYSGHWRNVRKHSLGVRRIMTTTRQSSLLCWRWEVWNIIKIITSKKWEVSSTLVPFSDSSLRSIKELIGTFTKRYKRNYSIFESFQHVSAFLLNYECIIFLWCTVVGCTPTTSQLFVLCDWM